MHLARDLLQQSVCSQQPLTSQLGNKLFPPSDVCQMVNVCSLGLCDCDQIPILSLEGDVSDRSNLVVLRILVFLHDGCLPSSHSSDAVS